jgi:superfamily I DNA and/or RNA helicase
MDRRRLNVALTRAKDLLIVVGDSDTFNNGTNNSHPTTLTRLMLLLLLLILLVTLLV